LNRGLSGYALLAGRRAVRNRRLADLASIIEEGLIHLGGIQVQVRLPLAFAKSEFGDAPD